MRSKLPFLLLLFAAACAPPEPQVYYKGNLHTHTLWSDGDEFPELVVKWYRDNGWDFLALSDHNTLQEGDRWVYISEARDLAYVEYIAWDATAVDQQIRKDSVFVRLATFDELVERFQSAGQFILVQSEEITDRFEDKPLHVNATGIHEHIAPQGGSSVTDVLQRNIDAVLEQREATGRPMVPHVNHPNFGWAVTPDDLVPLTGEHFFEVYNGHPAVHNEGDDTRPGTEAMWDYVNTERLAQGLPLLFGLAVDDAHGYHDMRTGVANPGRGWVMVRADSLTTGSVIGALEAGAFYGSSGVTISRIEFNGRRLEVDIEPEEDVFYTTYFRGTREGGEPGQLLATVEGPEASYRMTGDDLFVRATVVSTKLKPNPYREGEFEMAWVQPVTRD
ncbi:MAG: hypothetical protein JJ896_01370 [Rhodothermales bacterium]|nr:hypothetical protein [Rhodothermales bacterium]MBO6778278.1 hypothetical protein [Rhodothermales bacterium]